MSSPSLAMQRIISVLVFALALLAAGAKAQPSAIGSVRAVSVQGAVNVINDATQQSTPVTEGEVITQGLSVQTAAGASVTLLFSNGSAVVVAQSSRLDISTFLQDPFSGSLANLTEEPTTSTTKLKLAYGELIASVKKLNVAGGSSFDVETPVGAAGVRGTTFQIRYDSSTHRMIVRMGTGTILVTIPSASGGKAQTKSVSAGHGITLTTTVSASGQVTVTATSSTVPQATLELISATATSTANAMIANPPPPAGTFTETTTTSANGTKTVTQQLGASTVNTVTTPVNPTNVSTSD